LAHNLKIKKRETEREGKIVLNVDVTDEFLETEKNFVAFFKFLYNKDAITQKQLVSYFVKDKKEQSNYRWNYTDDYKLKLDCNQTRPTLLSKFSKEDKSKFTDALELKLWHII
jgi:CRISPR-associated endonuclease Csn1